MAVSIEQLVNLLTASDDFASLSDQLLVELARHLKIKKVLGGTKIIAEGAESDYMFILVSGRLRVSRQGSDGKLLLYNEVLPGDSVGETGMVLEQTRTADIFAMRDSTLAILSKNDYSDLIKKHPIAFNKVFSLAIYRQLRHQRTLHERRRAQSYCFISLHQTLNSESIVNLFDQALRKFGTTHVITSKDVRSAIDDHSVDLNLDLKNRITTI